MPAALVRGVDDRPRVEHGAVGAGVLHQHAAQLALGQPVGQVGHHDRDAHRPRPGSRTTAIVCGSAFASTTNGPVAFLLPRRTSVIASAAAVPSSSSDAFAVGRPVRSPTMVWKFSSASSRPCEISGWYGVYAVYQLGSSSTFRRTTGGVIVPW